MTDAPNDEHKEAQAEQAASPQQNGESAENHLAAKRGRMVMAGVVATLTLAIIAVAVYGIFHATAGWFMKCPSDVAINDPAPALWERLDTSKVEQAPLGVPKDLAGKVTFKGAPDASE